MKSNRGVLSCYDAKTGSVIYGPQRLRGIRGVYASLVGVQERIYIAGLEGTTLVVKHGPKFQVLASNKLNEGISASPVIVGEELFLRGTDHLYCIAKD